MPLKGVKGTGTKKGANFAPFSFVKTPEISTFIPETQLRGSLKKIDQSGKGSSSPVNSRILCKSSTSYCDVSPIGTTTKTKKTPDCNTFRGF
jgi:hypothetical protein